MQKIILNKYDYIKYVLKSIVLIIYSFITAAIVFTVTAAVVCKINFSYSVLLPVTALNLAIISFFNGFVISRWFKEKGIIWGIIAGIIIFGFVIIVSVCNGLFQFTTLLVIKAVLTVTSGAIGGIIGVNTN